MVRAVDFCIGFILTYIIVADTISRVRASGKHELLKITRPVKVRSGGADRCPAAPT
jgi:hypothetical protein